MTWLYLPCNVGDVTAQVSLQPALKFNGGGHINHTIFWTNLSPNGGGEPQGMQESRPKYHTLAFLIVLGTQKMFVEIETKLKPAEKQYIHSACGQLLLKPL